MLTDQRILNINSSGNFAVKYNAILIMHLTFGALNRRISNSPGYYFLSMLVVEVVRHSSDEANAFGSRDVF